MLSKTAQGLLLSSLFVVMLTVRLMNFVGVIGSDDITYNRGAYDILQGTFVPHLNHQQTRIGLLVPVAFAFRLFGIHEISSAVFPLFCTIVTFFLLVYAGTTYWGAWGGILAGGFYTLLPLEIPLSTELLPDLPAATWIAASAILFFQMEQIAKKQPAHGKIRSIQCSGMCLAGLFLGWAYLIKETSVFFGVFLVGYMGYTIIVRKTFHHPWLWFALGVVIVVGLECGFYLWKMGNPFYRYLSVDAGHNVSLFSGQHFQGRALVRRLTVDLLRTLFQVKYFSFYTFFILAGMIYGIRSKTPFIRFLIGWFVTMALLFNFGSSSVTRYKPLLLFHRFLVVFSVPGILILTWFLLEMRNWLDSVGSHNNKLFQASLVVPFVILSGIALVDRSVLIRFFWISMAGFLVIAFSRRIRTWLRRHLSPPYESLVLPVMIVYLNLLPGIYLTAKGEYASAGVTIERDIRAVLEFPLQHAIYTDSRTEVILEYLYQYQEDNRIVSFDEADVRTLSNVYVIANWERVFFLNRTYHEPIPDFLYHPPAAWRLRFQLGGDVNPCLIYETP